MKTLDKYLGVNMGTPFRIWDKESGFLPGLFRVEAFEIFTQGDGESLWRPAATTILAALMGGDYQILKEAPTLLELALNARRGEDYFLRHTNKGETKYRKLLPEETNYTYMISPDGNNLLEGFGATPVPSAYMLYLLRGFLWLQRVNYEGTPVG